ncbi:hypothetical protein AWC38_SpisGene263 [Stylophora pistillata]|uniref:Integrase catalytic domain-containing protein n=1 Tax=Stylophora pistillata TaxID=50429 RepID=A0A2B4SXY3_STYPI|nr:hypothetical protein AWC38_SpisGene263 [Stylophora pistillata]
MRAAIQESANCPVCASYSSSLPKEPMLSHKIPHGPRKFISQDLFKQGGWWYAVTIDHYSDWFEVDQLNKDITAAHVISVTKARFARYCVSDKFLSDNGPSMSLRSLQIWPWLMKFQLITRSPYCARATGKAGSAVKEAKKMLKKSDLPTGLLEHRNTPPQGNMQANYFNNIVVHICAPIFHLVMPLYNLDMQFSFYAHVVIQHGTVAQKDQAVDLMLNRIQPLGADNILALQCNTTTPNNVAAELILHMFQPNQLEGRNIHRVNNKKPPIPEKNLEDERTSLPSRKKD